MKRLACLLAALLLPVGCADDSPTPVTSVSPPTIAFAADTPTVGAATVVTKVVAADETGVAEVRLYADDRWVARADRAPYELVWSAAGLAEGLSTLRAVAVDSDGNEASATTIFQVDHTGPELTVEQTPVSPDATHSDLVLSWQTVDASAARFVYVRLLNRYGNESRWRCDADTAFVETAGCETGTVTLQAEDEVGNLSAARELSLSVAPFGEDCWVGLSLAALPQEGHCEAF
jgi:hypothetical protein